MNQTSEPASRSDFVNGLLSRKDRLGVTRGEVPTRFRGPCLNQYWAPLRTARNVERASDLIKFTVMVDTIDRTRSGVYSSPAIINDGIRRPAFP